MKSTFTVACICLKSVWQAVLLRAALATLLLAPLAALHATETTSKEPNAPLTTVASSTVTAAVSHRLRNEKIGVGIADGGEWSSPDSGSWSTPENWASNAVADGAGFTAKFDGIPESELSVTLDSPRTIGYLIFAARFDPLTGSVSVVPAAR
jgi:hypothetical protein